MLIDCFAINFDLLWTLWSLWKIQEDSMALFNSHFFSEVLGLSSSMYVIVPQKSIYQSGQSVSEGYGAESNNSNKYPVLYLLHGLSDDHTIWLRRTSVERYAEEMSLAVVMPEVHRSFYTDMTRGGRYWTFISEELPVIVRSFFPISAAREDNFVAGLSMGGYGAFRLGLGKPGNFAAAASFSGALDMAVRMKDKSLDSDEMENIFGDPDSMAGSRNDLFYLASELKKSGAVIPRLYQWCGTEDFLYKDNLNFRDHVLKLGFDLTYEEGSGDHSWKYWDRQIQSVLEWLPLKK
jgi:putative tributyrin esterase